MLRREYPKETPWTSEPIQALLNMEDGILNM